jgi:putative membrane protein
VLATESDYLNTLPAFLAFFAAALALLALFLAVYALVTPHRELRLIRDGNLAAALSTAGALLGFVIPLASVIENSISLIDMTVWGLVAMAVQVLTFLAARLLLPGLVRQIEEGRLAPAVALATLSLAVGMLNAACVTY